MFTRKVGAGVAGLALMTGVACTGEGARQTAGESRGGVSEQPLLFPTTSTAPFEQVDLQGPIDFSYYSQSQITAFGLPPRRCDGIMTDQGRAYSLSLEGSVCTETYFNLPLSSPSYDRPYINSNYHYDYFVGGPNSGSSLQLTLPPRTIWTQANNQLCSTKPDSGPCALPGPDRAELTVYSDGFEQRDGVGFGLNDPKYFGFLMYLPAPSGFSLVPGDTGNEGVHFTQAWQYHTSEGTGCGVPFVGTLQNATSAANQAVSPVEFYLTATDEAGSHVLDDRRWPLTVNTWHRFLFFLSPNNNETEGQGQITAWLDGKLITDWHHDWGCDVMRAGSAYSDQWHLRVGMYRTDKGPMNQRLDLFFDDIRVAPSSALATIF